ncbi:MAG TPA: FeoB-associated Cys-rich membrane protein [Candidatus Hydrogenedentes bacterium]|nr:FeoB-associated Cys-rich membrane protein [Candidatus Hydrogenedentota bacterium]HNT88108.1 FeoB-associated Cys-rich membrane protein [Candidatus Hydrogenedentota bacterium]
MIESIVVLGIIVCAAVFVVRRVYGTFVRAKRPGSCSDGGCSGCGGSGSGRGVSEARP